MPQPRHNDTQIANSPTERLLASAMGYVAGVKIESGIPMPFYSKGRYERTGKWWRVFEAMTRGDSFVLPKTQMNTLRNSARKLGVKIVIQHQGNETWRIWKAT